MIRLLTILLTGASLGLVSCQSMKKEACDSCCDSKPKSACCDQGAAAKKDCCDSTKKS